MGEHEDSSVVDQLIYESALGRLTTTMHQGAAAVVREVNAHDASKVDRHRIVRAARWAKSLSHENIVPILAVKRIDDKITIVSAHVPGTPLARALVEMRIRGVVMPLGVALRVAADVLEAASALHGRKKPLLHDPRFGGVCPEGIWLGEDGRARLFEPGASSVASLVEPFADDADRARYRAPETLPGDDACSAASDVFAVGTLVEEIAHLDDAPDEVTALLARARKPVPEDRFATAAEMLAAIEPLEPSDADSVSRFVEDLFVEEDENATMRRRPAETVTVIAHEAADEPVDDEAALDDEKVTVEVSQTNDESVTVVARSLAALDDENVTIEVSELEDEPTIAVDDDAGDDGISDEATVEGSVPHAILRGLVGKPSLMDEDEDGPTNVSELPEEAEGQREALRKLKEGNRHQRQRKARLDALRPVSERPPPPDEVSSVFSDAETAVRKRTTSAPISTPSAAPLQQSARPSAPEPVQQPHAGASAAQSAHRSQPDLARGLPAPPAKRSGARGVAVFALGVVTGATLVVGLGFAAWKAGELPMVTRDRPAATSRASATPEPSATAPAIASTASPRVTATPPPAHSTSPEPTVVPSASALPAASAPSATQPAVTPPPADVGADGFAASMLFEPADLPDDLLHTDPVPGTRGVTLGLPEGWQHHIKHNTTLIMASPSRDGVVVAVARDTRSRFPTALSRAYVLQPARLINRQQALWGATTTGKAVHGWSALVAEAESSQHETVAALLDVPDGNAVLVIGTWPKTQARLGAAFVTIVAGARATEEPVKTP